TRCCPRLSRSAGGRAAVPSVAPPRRAGPRRRQAAGGIGGLGRGNGTAAGGVWCRGRGAHRCRRPAARRGPTQRRLGSPLCPFPRAFYLARLAVWPDFAVTATFPCRQGKSFVCDAETSSRTTKCICFNSFEHNHVGRNSLRLRNTKHHRQRIG